MVRSTTVLALRHQGKVIMASDGQVTMGNTVVKAGARKVRKLHNDQVLAGFAGATADAFTLFERLEGKLQSISGNLPRAAVELAKDWRTDKHLRRLEALLLAADKDHLLMISGSGDVIEPEKGVAAIGSGGPYALSAARALMEHTETEARSIVNIAMGIAADICIYTNHSLFVEEI
ncbi:peptidase [Dethiosulfatarculus sandiegensis]|uniref:ATP-dependent protease subunit HslV n=1 Tax=Dethiosulfatarculus sandiegensis TaxID=1429043 RepID=A0A0D2J7I6_9BACT|nr:peptidase [Dethiosulfatarculus sandiegensis]